MEIRKILEQFGRLIVKTRSALKARLAESEQAATLLILVSSLHIVLKTYPVSDAYRRKLSDFVIPSVHAIDGPGALQRVLRETLEFAADVRDLIAKRV